MIGEPIPTLEEMRYNPIMPTNRIAALLAAAAVLPLVAWAQDPPQGPATDASTPASSSPLVPGGKAAEPPASEAEKAIDEAAAKLRATESLAADIAVDVDMLSQRFRVVGQYLKGPSYRVLLRLQLEGLGDVSGNFQQISDGAVLWELNQILDGPRSLRKITLQPLMAVLNKPEADPEIRDRLLTQIGFAGPEALLNGLRKSIAFNQMEESTLDGRPVLIVRGTWKDRESLGLPQAPNIPPDAPDQAIVGAAAFLPLYVPSAVELWIDREDGWPHRLSLKGQAPSVLRDDRILGPDGRPIGRKSLNRKERPTSITLVYRRQEKAPEPSDFLFTPPTGQDVQDDTDQAVAALEAEMDRAAALKRNAAGDAGDLLDQPLTAPRPDGGPDSKAPPAPAPAPSPETFRSTAPPQN